MPLQPPQLDDRTFDDILAEAKLRLQRYCPEWTDFNDSDPGMALVQLFAWLTELMLYRINKIPEQNYITFLKMLKLERKEARPSKTQVVMTVGTSKKPEVRPVRDRSKFFVTAVNGDALTFETTEAIDLVPYPLDAVQVFDGLNYADYSKTNDSGTQTVHPLGATPQIANALYLGFHPDQETPILSVFPEQVVIHFFFPPKQKTVVQDSDTTSFGQQLPKLIWEYKSNLDNPDNTASNTTGTDTSQNDTAPPKPFDPDRWRPLTVIEDSTKSLTQEGRFVLRGPGADCLAMQSPKPTDDESRFWIRCRLTGGTYAKEDVPEISFVRCNVVNVENRSTIQNEFVGLGDGTQNLFRLQNQPVDRESLELVLVNDDGSEEACQLKDDFYASTRDDLHFTLNQNSGEIQFGNGDQGRTPGAGQSVVAKSYRAGGGISGNIAADSIKDPPQGVSGLESVTNPRPAQGGIDEELLKDLLDRAPRVLRGDARAVTKDDYRRFAEEIPGVGRAIVLPQRLPQHPGLKIPGAITVVVIPKAPIRNVDGQSGPGKFLPPVELLNAVYTRLNDSRPAGTELAVVAPRLHELDLLVSVVPSPGISENQAQNQVKQALEHYFQPVEDAPILPAIDPITHQARRPPAPRWEIGSLIYPSRLYEVLFSARDSENGMPLVQDIADLTFKDGAQVVALGRSLQLENDELPYVRVTVQIASGTNRRTS